ncbi:hypothetical protein IFU37_008775 [Pantoea agglomerans]|uniref:hypothetical protein n=1 Tax=Enterobacter agglomerans TaxID=549 RepID=UPI0017857B64|nr:hypothetical protein [Pantoea agglomerans]WVL91417.1 hypothetical protein IFU37_008775 [Pantoea agglomerans]
MQNSSQPKLISVPFSDSGSKQDIPNASQIGINAGRASYADGFPPLTRTPLAAGGVPPFGTDFNGIFNDITSAVRWSQSGAGYPYNASFSTSISGYPKGARIPNSTYDGFWLNTTEGNSSSPESSDASLTGWVPAENYGITIVSGLSGSSLTLSSLQAAKERLVLSGALTANINLIVPAWRKTWTIINNCTGNFSVTIKTQSGSGVSIPSSTTRRVYGDGANIAFDLGSAAFRDVGIGTNQIPDVSSFVYGVNGNGAYRTMPGTFQLCRNLVTVPSNSTYTWTFPLAFTATPGVYYSSLNPSSSAASAMWFNGVGTTSCSIFNPNSISISANLLAIF